MTVDEGRKAALRGRLVEAVRLIFVAVFGAVGYQLGTYATATTGGRAILYVFLGAASGYVCGGVFGRLTLEAVRGLEKEFSRRPAAEVAGGVVGLVIGLVVAALLCLPMLFIPVTLSWPAALFVFLVLGSLGIRLGQAKYEDIFGLFGMKPRATARAGGDVHVVDTSALIDGRIADLVSTGFISGIVLLQFQLVEEPGVQDVDAALVRLARERSASLITVDHNLAKVAEALRVPVAQINALASKFRLPYTAGDGLVVRLVKDGREHGQGVGYLDDGTMVVVEDAAGLIGGQVEVQVRNVLQTTTGRMIFANLDVAAQPG